MLVAYQCFMNAEGSAGRFFKKGTFASSSKGFSLFGLVYFEILVSA